MASRNYASDLRTPEHGLVEFDGILALTSAAAVDATNTRILSQFWSIAKTGTGIYQITLSAMDRFAVAPGTPSALVSWGFTIGFNATPGNIQNVVLLQLPESLDLVNAGTINFGTVTGAGALADTTSAMRIAINLQFKNSSVVP